MNNLYFGIYFFKPCICSFPPPFWYVPEENVFPAPSHCCHRSKIERESDCSSPQRFDVPSKWVGFTSPPKNMGRLSANLPVLPARAWWSLPQSGLVRCLVQTCIYDFHGHNPPWVWDDCCRFKARWGDFRQRFGPASEIKLASQFDMARDDVNSSRSFLK